MTMKNKCNTCRYFDFNKILNDSLDGDCHRNPPNDKGTFNRVKEWYWCGEWLPLGREVE
jgi:hypothetical protein